MPDNDPQINRPEEPVDPSDLEPMISDDQRIAAGVDGLSEKECRSLLKRIFRKVNNGKYTSVRRMLLRRDWLYEYQKTVDELVRLAEEQGLNPNRVHEEWAWQRACHNLALPCGTLREAVENALTLHTQSAKPDKLREAIEKIGRIKKRMSEGANQSYHMDWDEEYDE
jgi:hypothetical protein